MKLKDLKYIISLFTVLFLFSCSEKLPLEEVNLNLTQEILVNDDDETDENFVSPNQAAEIATKFFNRETGATTRALASAKVETVKDAENRNQPAFYVVNYPEGGWAIISSTQNYFPVLAHSDEGYFDLETVPLTGVSVWFEETKEAIRVSEAFDEETKSQVRSQWLIYEEANMRNTASSLQTRNPTAMANRINTLYNLYSSSGWYYYYSLDDALGLLDYSTWQSLVNMANSYGASTEYSIVAIRSNIPPTTSQTGPLLATKIPSPWHQDYPLNYFCEPNTSGAIDNYPAGCVAVAMGQIMRYHTKPALVTSPTNHKYNWNNMSIDQSSSLPVLIRAIGVDVNMKYAEDGSSAYDSKAQDAFKNKYGYTSATLADHDASTLSTVRTHLYNNRPVYMSGDRWDAAKNKYIGHAWVCDGVKSYQTKAEYFVEFFYNGSYGTYSSYSPSYPGITTDTYYWYYMTWGWANSNDGWFTDNNIVMTNGRNYMYNRKNIYVTP